MRYVSKIVLTLAASALCAGALSAQPNASKDSKAIQVDGSSTVEPVTSAVTAEFAKVRPDLRLSVAVSGTSGGFRRFVGSVLGLATRHDGRFATLDGGIEALARDS